MNLRRAQFALLAVAIATIAAVPALAGTGTPNAPGQQKEKTPSAPITISGTVAKSTADGETTYTLTDGGKTYTLGAGPRWFFDAGSYPLEKYVGKSVTIEGKIAEGSTDVDVISVDGKALRASGKPPWAGGWKVVGEKHPGWAQWKVDKAAERDAAKTEKGNGPPPWAGPKSPEPSPGG